MQAYDAAMLINSAAVAVKGNLADQNAVRAALKKAAFTSVRGPFKFNINGYPIEDFYLTKVAKRADGKYETQIVEKIFSNYADGYAKDCKTPIVGSFRGPFLVHRGGARFYVEKCFRFKNYRVIIIGVASKGSDRLMRAVCLGGGPGGLYFAISLKLRDPTHEVVVIERNRPNDTFGWGVVLSDETLANLAGQ